MAATRNAARMGDHNSLNERLSATASVAANSALREELGAAGQGRRDRGGSSESVADNARRERREGLPLVKAGACRFHR